MMSLKALENLLAERIGLNVESIGAPAIARAVNERQRACRLSSTLEYWEHVQTSEAELQELIEAVVVSETWFFRDAEAFAALARSTQDWLAAHPTGSLHALSLPCATGEEPFSIAIALIDAGFPPERFSVDAIDISERAVRHARHGHYGNNSFRGADLQFRDRHFHPTASGYQLSDCVRGKVQFKQGNLFALDVLSVRGSYHIVFCRNVLIYFDESAQRRGIEVLARVLEPDGMMFVGPAETALLSSHDFVSTRVPLAFAFRTPGHGRAAARGVVAPPAPASRIRLPVAAGAVRRVTPRAAPATRHAGPARTAPLAPEPSLDLAVQLANQGLIAQAAAVCSQQLQLGGPSARGLHLMGLLSEAAGKTREAAEYHRQALYLEPAHLDALHHLALLLDAQGNSQAAETLRGRARRLPGKGRE